MRASRKRDGMNAATRCSGGPIALTGLFLLLILEECRGMPLPGMAPKEWKPFEKVPVRVNTLTSVKTQMPYRYYTLPFCSPGEISEMPENLGEILMGDVIESSPYDVRMQQAENCKKTCTKRLNVEDVESFRRSIFDDYQINLIADSLPAARMVKDDRGRDISTIGVPVGRVAEEGTTLLHNHLRFILKFHQPRANEAKFRIVGFEVVEMSVAHGASAVEAAPDSALDCSQTKEPLVLEKLNADAVGGAPVTFSYDVVWEESPVRWASRFDVYLRSSKADAQIHWFSIGNSLMIILFLSGMVAMILLRTLHKDIARYNEMALAEEAYEETGWKLVHGDVFRKPPHSQILACSAGSGVQLVGMVFVLLLFVGLGFLSPVYRGSILQTMVLLFTFLGIAAGYVSSRFYKMMKGQNWKRTTLLTAFLYPGTVFSVFFCLNVAMWCIGSSGAVPFSTLFVLLCLWFGISTPLVCFGAYLGYQAQTISLPVRTNQIPRQVPTQPWFMSGWFCCCVGGVLPFGAVFTELFFILTSLWQHHFYSLFGFLFCVVVILVATCAEISITLTYFQLASEDYNWWWRSFFVSASSAFYVFAYSVIYFHTRLQTTYVLSTLLYFGYMFIASYTFFLLTGAVGFLSSFLFVRAIYGSIKVD